MDKKKMEIVITIGRESDGTPIVLADVTTSVCYRADYRRARVHARQCSTGHLEAFLEGFRSTWHGKLIYHLFPGAEINAYKDVLRERKKEKDSRH